MLINSTTIDRYMACVHAWVSSVLLRQKISAGLLPDTCVDDMQQFSQTGKANDRTAVGNTGTPNACASWLAFGKLLCRSGDPSWAVRLKSYLAPGIAFPICEQNLLADHTTVPSASPAALISASPHNLVTRRSAICTALRAAPLRRLSLTIHRFSPCSTLGSQRSRLTSTRSSPAHSSAVA